MLNSHLHVGHAPSRVKHLFVSFVNFLTELFGFFFVVFFFNCCALSILAIFYIPDAGYLLDMWLKDILLCSVACLFILFT